MNKRVIAEAYRAVRPIGVSVLATGVVACVMAGQGWQHISMVLAAVIGILSFLIAYQVHRAVSRLQRQTSDARQAALQAEHHYISVLQRIMSVTESRDSYSRGRSERIGRLAEGISRNMGLPADKCGQMNLAGQLHDIGLLAVSDSVLKKQSLLATKEVRALQKHSEVSYELLRPLESLKDVLPAIRYHHERMNGTGYPLGLIGEKMPLEARILAVADSYDAMTHDRPTRSAMTPAEAMDELRRCSPAGYDTQCVLALAAMLHMVKPTCLAQDGAKAQEMVAASA